METNEVYKWAKPRTQRIMRGVLDTLSRSDETVATNQADLVENHDSLVSPVIKATAEQNQLMQTGVDSLPNLVPTTDGEIVAIYQADLIENDISYLSPVANIITEQNQLRFTEVDPVPSTSRSTTDGEIVLEQVVVLPESENEHFDSDRDPEFEPSLSENEVRDNENSSENENPTADVTVAGEVGRRRRAKRKHPDSWALNIRKRDKNLGRSYKRTTGRIREERKPKNLQTDRQCALKCNENISDDCKKILCKNFWDIGSIERQRDYIISHVTRKEAARNRKEDSRRKFSQSYYFDVDGIQYRVCKRFFLETLDISEKFVRISLEKSGRSRTGVASPDRRGKHTPGNKISEENINFATAHIDSFPRVPAHWCRKDTKKEYLEAILNRQKMYDLYKGHCAENGKKPISFALYKELLIKKNIAFHIPRKDQCWCHHFELLSEAEKTPEKIHEYELHIRRKIAANDEKSRDAQRTKENTEYVSANFDLEAVLYSPLFHAKPIFYKRKLATFNLTVFDVRSKQGYCYIWPEFEGKRGANEIATCVRLFLEELPANTKHVVLHSDCCPGQNRNAIMVYMLYQSVQTIKNIEIIDMKFLEPGHTHMQCDSMHATIEHAAEYAKIYWPNDWINVIKLAAKKRPYKVKTLDHTSFANYKEMQQKQMIISKAHASKGNTLNWKQVKWVRVEKSKPNTLLYKNEYWEEEFSSVTTTSQGRKAKNAPANVPVSLYSEKLAISKLKYDNLVSMCQGKDAIIPSEYKNFYTSIPVIKPAHGSNVEESDDDMSLQQIKEQLIKRKRRRN